MADLRRVPLYPASEVPTKDSLPASVASGVSGDARRIPLYPPSEVLANASIPAAPLTGIPGDTRRIPLVGPTEAPTISTLLGTDVAAGGVVLPTLAPTTASFTAGATSGSLITAITGLSSGETISSVSPNDGRVAISSGSALVVGLTASSAGTISYTLTTSLGRTLTVAVTATSAVAGAVLRILVWGQSNAQALGTATTANGGFNASQVMPTGYTGPNARVKIWTGSAFETYQPYVNSEQGSNPGTTWGSEWATASKWLADNPTGNVYIVKHVVGSTGLAAGSSGQVWAPSSGQLYTAMTNKVTASAAAAAAQGVTFNAANTVVIQSQGEQDATAQTYADPYQTNLTAYISQARTDWSALRWIIERIHLENTSSGRPGWVTVYNAQTAIVAADANVELVSCDGLPLADEVHYTVGSCQTKASRTADVVTRFWLKAAAAGQTYIFDTLMDRYVRAATAGDLTTMKSGLPEDVLACSAASSAQRTYIDGLGIRRAMTTTNSLRFSYGDDGLKALLHEAVATNACLQNRDLTNTTSWTLSGLTATKDTPARDGVANSGTRITVNTAGGTATQVITRAVGDTTSSVELKRLSGSGTVDVSQDNGAAFTTLGANTNWQYLSVPWQNLTNPTIILRFSTVGDVWAIGGVQCEIGRVATSLIYTAGNTVTRQLEKVTFKVATDAQGTAGTMVYRGKAAVLTAAQMIGGDNTKGLMLRQTLATQAQTSNDADTKLLANAGSGSFSGSFAIALSFDATGRKLCFNGGTVASDTNPVASRTSAPTVGAASNTNALTQTGGPTYYVSWGPSATNDNSVFQALATAS